MKLYSYFRSSAAYRVRIGLYLKGIPVEQAAVHLLNADQLTVYQCDINPQGLIPALDGDDGLLVQSLAILEYLEESKPEPPLLPEGLGARAYVRAAAQLVACDIHPLANLRVLRYLKHKLGHSQDDVDTWYRHWVEDGLGRLEAYIIAEGRSGRFIHGDQPSIADCCLVPQLFNARRLHCHIELFPTLLKIDAHCCALEPFQRAHPALQPDAE